MLDIHREEVNRKECVLPQRLAVPVDAAEIPWLRKVGGRTFTSGSRLSAEARGQAWRKVFCRPCAVRDVPRYFFYTLALGGVQGLVQYGRTSRTPDFSAKA